jgi:hypothetical protein
MKLCFVPQISTDYDLLSINPRYLYNICSDFILFFCYIPLALAVHISGSPRQPKSRLVD